ncbi:MAG: T9SS type A sorting domain-containing protein, partial [Bacteroidota bacterium]
DGGAMSDAFGAPTLINVSFSKNHAQRGGAIFSDDTEATLINVSFSLNTASNEGGAMYNINFGEAISISNSIFYGNTANGSVNSIATSNFGSAPFMTISYSYFDDASLSSDIVDGGNNLLSQADPFVDAANEDLQLVAFSTAIDAGDNSQNSSSEDAASNARNYDDIGVTDTGAGTAPIIDMGAFERQTDSEDNCPSDPIMLSVPETGTTDYITQAEITSTQSIESGAVVLYQAGTTITLSAGFHAKSGSTFTARIEDCAAQNSTEETIEERSEETNADKTAQALQVAVFPNPFSSTTNIQFHLAQAGDVVLTITDMNGKVVHQQQYLDLPNGEYQHQFEANHLPDGMYFLHIRSAEEQVVKQLIIQE